YSQMQAQNAGNILQFLSILSGGALSKGTLLALGVSPYITASIVVQLLTIVFKKLQDWSKDGAEGQKKLNALTRIITVVLALVTSIGYALYLKNGYQGVSYLTVEPGFFEYAVIIACFCAGAALVMWLAELINESGIGNGISIILFANILAGSFSRLTSLWATVMSGGETGTEFSWWGLGFAGIQVVVLLGLLILIVWMSDAERRIPIQYAKRVVGRKMYGGQNTNLPIKVNMSGVMPIIFANSIVALLPTIAAFIPGTGFANFVNEWFTYYKWSYFFVFFVLLIAFAFFYISISFNPVEVANNIKNNGGAIPGIRSGRPTVEFIKKVLNRITLVGALLVAVVACLPMLITNIAAMTTELMYADLSYAELALRWGVEMPEQVGLQLFSALAFGGSSMMIVVGVALETFREIEAQMSLRNYKGFLD
ncbi:MAG: preprotein translocase subunit SecY, partial [Clostridia bacterium]|nr:preprotein translocase subunit SecY [Clostridia bacterium]